MPEVLSNPTNKMKYKLTKNTKDFYGTTLYQIEAIVSFGSIIKGELGGYIEKEGNLSQEGNAQVSGDAWVSGNAWVSGELKLIAGYFFGIRYKKEEIKYIPVDEDYELIYKGEAKFGEETPKGKSVKVKLKGGEIVEGEIVD